MNELENKLRNLKLKKAMLFANIESLSEIDDSLFTQFGKVEAEILKVEKEIVRKIENQFE
jgi:hypothetical protein